MSEVLKIVFGTVEKFFKRLLAVTVLSLKDKTQHKNNRLPEL